MKTQENRAKEQAKNQLESIKEMVAGLKAAQESNNEKEIESALQTIQEDPLSVEVRTGWHTPAAKGNTSEEYNILLCTGGPACRIIGDISEYQEPESARIEYQDWGTPWTDYPLSSEEEETVLVYCREFYFGE